MGAGHLYGGRSSTYFKMKSKFTKIIFIALSILLMLTAVIGCNKSEEVDLYSEYIHPDLLFSVKYPTNWGYFEEKNEHDEVVNILFDEQGKVNVQIISFSPKMLQSRDYLDTGYEVYEAITERLYRDDNAKSLEENDVFYGSLLAKRVTYKHSVYNIWWKKISVSFISEDALYMIVYGKPILHEDNSEGYFDYMVNSFRILTINENVK